VINGEGQSDPSKRCIKKHVTGGLSSIEYKSSQEERRNEKDRRLQGHQKLRHTRGTFPLRQYMVLLLR